MLSVNGREITPEQIEEEINALRPNYEHYIGDQLDENAREKQLREWARENVIERALLEHEAATDATLISGDELAKKMQEWFESHPQANATDESLRANVEMMFRMQALQQRVLGAIEEATDEELRSFYEAHKDTYKRPEMVRASHIVKNLNGPDEFGLVQREMEGVLAKLRAGEDFELLALQHSSCPHNGGDLDYFPRGQMVESFEDVVFNMKVGEISGVFQTEFGYHIAKLTDRRPEEIVPFDEVKDYVAQHMQESRKQEAMERFVDQLKTNADIQETQD